MTASVLRAAAVLIFLAQASPKKAGGEFVEVSVAKTMEDAKALGKLEQLVICEPMLYRTDVSGAPAIWAGGTASNPTNKKHVTYYSVALFDKDKRLIGAAGQKFSMDPGEKELQIASCRILVAAADFDRVKYAQWRLQPIQE